MRDYGFVLFLMLLLGTGFRRPFLFVLAYVYIDVVSPQQMSYLLLNSFPVSLVTFGLALLGWLAIDDKSGFRVAPRQIAMIALLAYCWYTTTFTADFPVEAQYKWEWVWKALVFAIFLPFTLRTRLRIEALLLFMLLSLASIVIVGGVKTVLGGGGYGELNLIVNNNTGLFESSIISCVSIAVIPLILWFTKHGTIFKPDWKVKLFAAGYVFACLLMPIGTSARTGLICVAVLGLLMLRDVKRRFLYVALTGALGLAAIPFLPSSFTDRMETIKTYKGDASASTRIAVWMWTLDLVKEKPMGGGFETYRQNKIRYDKVSVVGEDGNATVKRELEVDQARAFHSAYFEMLGEQGWPGLFLWCLIHFGGLWRMEVLRRRYRKPDEGEEWVAPLASALQHGHIVYLVGSLFVGIALNPFVYMLVGAQIGLDTYLGRRRAAASAEPMRRPRLATAA